MKRAVTRAIAALADIYGIERAYVDYTHRTRRASMDTLVHLLRARGAPLHDETDATDALRAVNVQRAGDGIEPVLVSWNGRLASVPLRLANATAERAVRYTIRFEDGAVRSRECIPEPIAHPRRTPGSPTHRMRGIGSIPIGYHDLEIETAAGTLTSRIIAAPRHAYRPHDIAEWGVFMPLYAMRNADDCGIGCYSDLARLARWTAARGGAFVGTLPLLASFTDACFEPSPYAPVSRLFWNEMFVDIERVPGWNGEPINATHDARHAVVDYRTVGALKLNALRTAADAYFANGDTNQLDRFAAAHARVADYARFRATVDRSRESWHAWPARMRDGDIRNGDFAPEDERFYRFAQWTAEEQVAAIAAAGETDAAGLYLDLPLGVNPDGYDAWRERDLFVETVSTGAPPDALFTGGQNWGFHPPHPTAQRASGHRYFIESLRHHMRHARMLRLDHVMSLYRLFWIPAGADSRDGAYVRYPVDEMFAILALESNRHHTAIVGEDLGTVPREIRTQMEKRSVLRMYVVEFEVAPDPDKPISTVPRDVIASINTHDMPTFRGFVLGTELRDQLDLGLVDEERFHADMASRNHLVQHLSARFGNARDSAELLRRILTYLAASHARAMLVNLEDLWLEDRPQNVPGTSTERKNWQRRAQRTLDEIMNDENIREILAIIDTERSAAARAVVAED